jgi:VCBS repeat protein/FG-GAP repeat protein
MAQAPCKANSRIFVFAAIFWYAAFALPYVGYALIMPAGKNAPVNGSGDDTDEVSHLMVMADLNRDGISDIVEAVPSDEGRHGSGFLKVMLGQAGGTYKLKTANQVLGHTPQSIVVGDFNRDGAPDVIVGDDDGTLMLFVGDGTGGFIASGDLLHFRSVVSIAVADFNHDGSLDLAVSDWRASSVTVLLGAGNGTFRDFWSFPLRMPGTVAQVVTADFNGDGISDLAVTYSDDEVYTFEVLLGNGNGVFTDAPSLSFVKDPNSQCAT